MENNNKKNIPAIAGQIVGAVLWACVALCISGTLIALTMKFLTWIF